MVGAKNLQVSKLIAQAELVVSLELAAMAGPADALKVFPAVWITGIQSPDEPRRHNVVHMAPDSGLLEIQSARFNLTLLPQSWHPPIPPSLPRWAAPRPLPVNPAPSYRPLLGTEARPAIEASSVAIGTMAAVNRLEHFCSSVSAIWTTHCGFLLSVDLGLHPPLKALGLSIGNFQGGSRGAGENAAELRLRVGWALAIQVKRNALQSPAATTKRPKRIRFLFAPVCLAC